tara:strand:- start:707 stop:1312 length:606 start_codon:yes stop_codon:yes gene_type:complete
MKTRNELPNFKKIKYQVDTKKLLKVLEDNKDKLIKYRDHLNVCCATPYLNELYEQIPITTLTEGSNYTVPLSKTGRGVEGDERNYTTLIDLLKGTYVEEVLNMFKSPTTRARFIIKKPGSHILPHMDYDTSYSVRYFIPIQTNEWSFTAVKRKNESPEIKHLQADGSVWFVNQGFYHSAWNFGKTDCMRLIVAVNGQDDLS